MVQLHGGGFCIGAGHIRGDNAVAVQILTGNACLLYTSERITRALIDPNVFSGSCEQLSLFSPPAVDNLIGQGVPPRAAVRMVREEAVQCLAKTL